jgi:hypothetical protein
MAQRVTSKHARKWGKNRKQKNIQNQRDMRMERRKKQSNQPAESVASSDSVTGRLLNEQDSNGTELENFNTRWATGGLCNN